MTDKILTRRGKLKRADIARFKKFLKYDPATGCLLWTGAKHKAGYGRFGLNGRVERAHRVAFVLAGYTTTRERPHVLHNCPAGDNPACCEPSHLWAGTDADNGSDKARKDRARRSAAGLPRGTARARNGQFKARVSEGGRLRHVGTFPTLEEAADAAATARSTIERFLPPLQEEGA